MSSHEMVLGGSWSCTVGRRTSEFGGLYTTARDAPEELA